MITISTRDYTTEQLRYLLKGLTCASKLIFDSPDCEKQAYCTTDCKAYAICSDLCSTGQYICKKIREREALELHRDTQESK